MEIILNLTQHLATKEQKAAGVIDLPEKERAELCKLLTFNTLEETKEKIDRANKIREIIINLPYYADIDKAMIGGALFFMRELENALWYERIEPVYAFTEREVIETQNADGTVTKTAVFKHKGFVPA
jgi:hypothetical protein